MRRWLPWLWVLCAGCGPAGGPPRGDGKVPPGGLDLTRPTLTAFVKGRGYEAWKAEAAVHASTGPHGKVRMFVNDSLYASLEAGDAAHPPGSAVVKELWDAEATAIYGHAIDVKDERGEWVWLEAFAPDYTDGLYYRGTKNLCAECHGAGRDYVLVPAANFP